MVHVEFPRYGYHSLQCCQRTSAISFYLLVYYNFVFDVVGVQEVRWDKEGTVREGDYDFFYGIVNDIHQLRTGFFVHRIIISAMKRVEFVSERLL